MGHWHNPRSFSDAILKRVFAKGKTTLMDITQARKDLAVHASEGVYDGEEREVMTTSSLEQMLIFHIDMGQVVMAPETDRQRKLVAWWQDENNYFGDLTDPDWIDFTNIAFTFSPGARRKYLDKTLRHPPSSITS